MARLGRSFPTRLIQRAGVEELAGPTDLVGGDAATLSESASITVLLATNESFTESDVSASNDAVQAQDSGLLTEATPAIQDVTLIAVNEALMLSEAAGLGLAFSVSDAASLVEALGVSGTVATTDPFTVTESLGLQGSLSAGDDAVEAAAALIARELLASDSFTSLDFASLSTADRVKVLSAVVTAAVRIAGSMQASGT